MFGDLVPAAKVTAVGGVVFVLVWTIASYATTKDVIFALISFLLTLISAVISVYDINCLFVGSCTVWGWFKTVMVILMSLTALIALYQVYDLRNRLMDLQKQGVFDELHDNLTDLQKQGVLDGVVRERASERE